MQFDSQISEVSSDQLENIFKGVPDTTPNADTSLPSGVKQIDDYKDNTVQGVTDNIPWFDEKVLATEPVVSTGDAEADQKAAEEAKVAEEAKKAAEAKAKEATEGKEVVEGEEGKKEDEDDSDEVAQAKNALLSTTNYLIEQGIWKDFEGRDNFDGSPEAYAKLALQQNQQLAHDMFSEMLDGTGDYGKAIYNHIQQGGNPDEIIDIFKEQKQIENIDSSTEIGKQEKIEKYYKEVLNWKPEKVAKHIKRIVEDNGVDEEFSDIDELYKDHFQKKLEEVNKEVTENKVKQEQRQNEFISNIKQALDGDDSLTPKEKKIIQSSITDFKHKLPDGRKVNDFYLKFAELQSDPKKYVKLVEIVMDLDQYDKKVLKRQSSAAAASTFNLIKGNGAASKSTTNNVTIKDTPPNSSAYKGTNFSFTIKR